MQRWTFTDSIICGTMISGTYHRFLSATISHFSQLIWLPGPSCWAAEELRGPLRLPEQGQVPVRGLLLELELELLHEEQEEEEGERLVELPEVEVVLLSEEQIWVGEKQILF